MGTPTVFLFHPWRHITNHHDAAYSHKMVFFAFLATFFQLSNYRFVFTETLCYNPLVCPPPPPPILLYSATDSFEKRCVPTVFSFSVHPQTVLLILLPMCVCHPQNIKLSRIRGA